MTKGQRARYLEAIKGRIGIARYFNEIIRPELDGYYDDYNSDLEVVDVVKCPLHTEDTPSFRIYRDTDSFYCFGCRHGGDVVALHRYFVQTLTGTKPDYEATLEYMYHRFCEGKEAPSEASLEQATQGVGSIIPKDEPKSTEPELIAYEIFIKSLEGNLQADQKVSMETKIQLYRAIDLANNLIQKNMVNATAAKNWLSKKKMQILLGKV